MTSDMQRQRELAGRIQEGDRVMYARGFLRSIGAVYGETPFREGTVELVSTLGEPHHDERRKLARVRWDDEPDIGTVALVNLVRKEDRHLEPR